MLDFLGMVDLTVLRAGVCDMLADHRGPTDGICSVPRAVIDGARAYWRAKHPQASEDELDEIMVDRERAAVKSYFESLPAAIWERLMAVTIQGIAEELLEELVAEGKAEAGLDKNDVLLARPTKGTVAAFERLVARRLAKKVGSAFVRDEDDVPFI
jgi:hypothetical protein